MEEKDSIYSITENGAVGYKTTGTKLLDMAFRVSSYRSMSEDEIIKDFDEAFHENKTFAIRWLFYVRDVRGGLGERRLFRVLLKHLATIEPETVAKLIPHIAEYGRFDDLLVLLDTEISDDLIRYINQTLAIDELNMTFGANVSLLAKWLPSANASSKASRQQALKIITKLPEFAMTERQYRKRLSKLRGYIDIVEAKMSKNKWTEIDYEKVPSKANLKYRNAFFRHDQLRRYEYLNEVSKGNKKINAKTLFPYEIVDDYIYNLRQNYEVEFDSTLELLWKNQNVPMLKDTLVVADGSGSMNQNIGGGTNATCLSVANSIAILAAERAKGPYKNKYITFSSCPKYVNLNGKSLLENIKIALTHCECSNTNIKKVFELILDTAISKYLNQDELPKNILIISDMEFDMGCDYTETLFDEIQAKYEKEGYKLPHLIFWNVCSRTKTIPMLTNPNGVTLVSGFSSNIFNMVMSGELDPYACLIKMLSVPRYTILDTYYML